MRLDEFSQNSALSSSSNVGNYADVALVTDGRFSGASHGIMIGHVSPEAAAGGAIALVEDGDVVTIDARNRRLDFAAAGGVRHSTNKFTDVT